MNKNKLSDNQFLIVRNEPDHVVFGIVENPTLLIEADRTIWQWNDQTVFAYMQVAKYKIETGMIPGEQLANLIEYLLLDLKRNKREHLIKHLPESQRILFDAMELFKRKTGITADLIRIHAQTKAMPMFDHIRDFAAKFDFAIAVENHLQIGLVIFDQLANLDPLCDEFIPFSELFRANPPAVPYSQIKYTFIRSGDAPLEFGNFREMKDHLHSPRALLLLSDKILVETEFDFGEDLQMIGYEFQLDQIRPMDEGAIRAILYDVAIENQKQSRERGGN